MQRLALVSLLGGWIVSYGLLFLTPWFVTIKDILFGVVMGLTTEACDDSGVWKPPFESLLGVAFQHNYSFLAIQLHIASLDQFQLGEWVIFSNIHFHLSIT